MKLKYVLIFALLAVVMLALKIFSCEFYCLARTDLAPTSLWETNDIIAVFGDGWTANEKAKNPNAFMFRKNIFFVVYASGMSISEAQKYLARNQNAEHKTIKNRIYKIDTAKLAVIDGEASATKATFESKLINKTAEIIEP